MNYKIRNWDRFQHYRDRCPPWIKLHYELLSSRDWVTLSNASRALAIASMLIASRHGGTIPDDPEYIRRVAYLHEPPDFQPLVAVGFLIPQADASKCSQTLDQSARPKETETETETETEKEKEKETAPPNSPAGGNGPQGECGEESEPGKKPKRQRFQKPIPAEVDEYLAEIEWTGTTGEAFCDSNEQQGWKLANGNAMKDWKAAIRTWRRRQQERTEQQLRDNEWDF